MMHRPMLAHTGPADVVAWRKGRGVTAAEFAAEALALADRLPERSYILNHCEDRYHFLLGLAAALLRRQVTLFPSSRATSVLEQLARDYPGVYCFTDQRAEPLAMMETVVHEPGAASSAPGDALARLSFPARQIAGVAFTSGSTGQPKSHTKTWGGFVHEAAVAGRALGLTPGARRHIIATVPPQHMYGFLTSVMLPLQYGHVLGADWPFYPEDIRRALAARGEPAILVTTPVHIRACVMEATELPAPAFILSSTAPLHKTLAGRAEGMFGTRVLEFYGSTETGAIAIRRQHDTDVWRTFDDITVAQTEAGFTVSAPYFYRSPIVLSDSVDVRNQREFTLFGRNADLVKIAGKRILLSDLNHRLLSIDGVVDGTFFLPDSGGGGPEGRLTAFVVAPGLTREQVLAALRERIDPVFLPRPLRMVDALPRNDTGKLPRGNLLRLLRDVQAQG